MILVSEFKLWWLYLLYSPYSNLSLTWYKEAKPKGVFMLLINNITWQAIFAFCTVARQKDSVIEILKYLLSPDMY